MSSVPGADAGGPRGALGVIAGTGFYSLDLLDEPETVEVATAFGSARAVVGRLHGRRTVFLARHGVDHSVPPHLIDYRANISALTDLGVAQVLAVNVVGGIDVATGDLVVVDDFVDFTKARVRTFYDGSTSEGVVHTDMTEPYDGRLRTVWLDAAAALGVAARDGGVYGAFEGPRFETRAEIRAARAMGVSVVGMTGVPEVVLARERDLPYASLCLVVNPAAGMGPPISVDDIDAVIETGARTVTAIIDEAARVLAS